MMKRKSERGRGRIATLFWLAVFAAVAYAAWNVGPLYYADYMLKDQMEAAARMRRSNRTDQAIEKALSDAVRDCGLEEYVRVTDFKVSMGELSRTISVEYEREANILPGWPHLFRFATKVEARVL